MRTSYTQSFKLKAVQKALSRKTGITLTEIAQQLGIGVASLYKWIKAVQDKKLILSESNNRESRPQDLGMPQRLELILATANMDEEALGAYCRKNGIFPHHIEQWKRDFIKQGGAPEMSEYKSDLKKLKEENKRLQKELNRKEKALAETAALLVLQKKVHELWGSRDEDI